MMTVREFITKVNFHEQYRIYAPNRDCLLFESYFTIHSLYSFKTKDLDVNMDYYNNNHYCRDVYEINKYDEETLAFLDMFGDYIIFSIECSSCSPMNISVLDGSLKIERVKEPNRLDGDYINCFNLFIKSKEN